MRREQMTPRAGIIPRPGINKLLEAGMEYPITSVIAGPGYGKTTAVADFCRSIQCKLAWLHLLPIDNDTGRFWNRLIDAFNEELPELANALKETAFPATLGAFDTFLRIFVNVCRDDKGTVLVLDNEECIHCELIHAFINSLIQAELDNLCVILISTRRSGTEKTIESGKHCLIGAGELGFSAEDIIVLFRLHGKEISMQRAEKLHEHTDGWPMALHLMAAQHDSSRRNQFGEISYLQVVAQIFERGYYDNYDPDLQLHLVKMTLLPSISLGVVKAVESVGLDRAMELFSQNAFISYDHPGGLFYFHKMYFRFLSQKQSLLDQETVYELFSTAGDWYCSNGFYREAMECFWGIRDYDRFISTIRSLPPVNRGTDMTFWILEKLNEFPEEYSTENPEVDFCRGFMHLNGVGIKMARESFLSVIERLESTEEKTPEQSALLGNTYAAMIEVSYALNNLDGMPYVKKALPLLPDGTDIRCDKTMVVGNNDVFFLPDGNAGTLEKMLLFNNEFAEYAKVLYRSSGSGFSSLFNAEAAYLSGNMQVAWEYSVKAFHTASTARMYDVASNAMFLQIRIAIFQGDCVKAQELLNDLTTYINAYMPIRLASLRDCAKGYFYLHMQDLKRIPGWLVDIRRFPCEMPIDIGRDRVICAASLYYIGDYEAALTSLLALDDLFNQRGLWQARLLADILRAACLLKMGDIKAASSSFWHAYDMTWRNNMTTCFAEFGQTTLSLLEAICARDRLQFDAKWLEKVLSDTKAFIKREAIMLRRYNTKSDEEQRVYEKLTPREKEVITYLAQGYTRENIASIMSISLHGVKKHIANIYRKLNAVNKMDAVNIAYAYGLIEAE